MANQYSCNEWTEFEDAYLIEQHTKKLSSIGEIATVLGRSKGSVKSRINRLGIICGSAIEIPEGYHFCTKCRGVLPVSEFSKDKRKSTGLSSYCKACALINYKNSLSRRLEELSSEEIPTHLTCATCGELRPIEEFWKHRWNKYGRQENCRYCTSAVKREERRRKE